MYNPRVVTSCFTCKRSIYILGDIYQCNYCRTPSWNRFFKIASKHKDVKDILVWFDTKIIMRMSDNTKTTSDVRIRIICGMINKNLFLTRDMKIELMELVWDKYKEMWQQHVEFVARSIHKVPF